VDCGGRGRIVGGEGGWGRCIIAHILVRLLMDSIHPVLSPPASTLRPPSQPGCAAALAGHRDIFAASRFIRGCSGIIGYTRVRGHVRAARAYCAVSSVTTFCLARGCRNPMIKVALFSKTQLGSSHSKLAQEEKCEPRNRRTARGYQSLSSLRQRRVRRRKRNTFCNIT